MPKFFYTKKMMFWSICLACFLSLGLSACDSKDNTETPTIEAQESYVLSDFYANHRAQQKLFPSSGGNIAYIDNGKGPVLVLLHGVPSSSWLYRKMIPELQQHFRVIAPDFLGYGSSDKPQSNEANYQAESQANYTRELLQYLEIDEYQLVFHDMGGLVAWDLVANDINTEQHNIKHITLLNTIISQQGFNHPTMDKGMVARMYANAFAGDLSSAAALTLTFKNMGLITTTKLSENECLGYVLPMQEGSGDALYEFFTGFNESLFSKLSTQVKSLNNYQGGATILWGAQDKVLTTKQFDVLKQSLTITEEDIIVFSQNAHFLPEEIPAELVQRILENK